MMPFPLGRDLVRLPRFAVVRFPESLAVGAHLEIVRPKSGTPPATNRYTLQEREGAAWRMTNGSLVPDSAPCWRAGRARKVR